MSRRDPRTQIHSGIRLTSPYCEEKEQKRETDQHTQMYFIFILGENTNYKPTS